MLEVFHAILGFDIKGVRRPIVVHQERHKATATRGDCIIVSGVDYSDKCVAGMYNIM